MITQVKTILFIQYRRIEIMGLPTYLYVLTPSCMSTITVNKNNNLLPFILVLHNYGKCKHMFYIKFSRNIQIIKRRNYIILNLTKSLFKSNWVLYYYLLLGYVNTVTTTQCTFLGNNTTDYKRYVDTTKIFFITSIQ